MCRDAHVKTPHIEDKQYLPGFGFMNNVISFLFFLRVQRFINTVKNTNTETYKYKTAPQKKETFQSAFLVVLLCDVVPNTIDLQEVRVHRKC